MTDQEILDLAKELGWNMEHEATNWMLVQFARALLEPICCNQNCNQGRDCPIRKVKAGTLHQTELPKIEFNCPAPSGLKALLLVLCITFVLGCIWFYKAVI